MASSSFSRGESEEASDVGDSTKICYFRRPISQQVYNEIEILMQELVTVLCNSNAEAKRRNDENDEQLRMDISNFTLDVNAEDMEEEIREKEAIVSSLLLKNQEEFEELLETQKNVNSVLVVQFAFQSDIGDTREAYSGSMIRKKIAACREFPPSEKYFDYVPILIAISVACIVCTMLVFIFEDSGSLRKLFIGNDEIIKKALLRVAVVLHRRYTSFHNITIGDILQSE